MNENFLILFIPSVFLFLLVGYMAVAGAKGSLERNAFFGIRTRTTSQSDISWKVAHKAASPYNCGAAVSFLVGGIVSCLGETESQMMLLLLSGWTIALVQMALGVRVAVSAAKDAEL